VSQPDFRAKIILEASVSPSEDPAKVVKALEGVVGEARSDLHEHPSSIKLTTEDGGAFVRLRDQLRDRHVRSAARRQMLVNASPRSTSLMLNRQAATAGVIALCGSPDESPLGPIFMRIESDRLQSVIDWMTAYSG